MTISRKDLKSIVKTAASNKDDRLRAFFDVTNSPATGPIYDELNELSKFTQKKEIARGGMKTIYSVFDRHADRFVAMATLHKGAAEETYEAFLREARLTAKLDHPNIIRVHEISLDDDQQPFFTMDLKTGKHLGEVIQDGKHSLNELIDVFVKICDAMSYAHSCGVIHLDLKPSNIQVGEHGEVIICDWGLGKVINDEDFTAEYNVSADLLNDMTINGLIKGTPGYMAPEQTGLVESDKGIHTDIYSMGGILYTILSGQRPIQGELKSVLKRTALGDFPKPSSFKKTPQRLEGICLKAMELDQKDRYSCPQALQKDIFAYRNGYLTSAEDFTFIKFVSLLFKRNKIISLTLVFAVLAVIVITFVFITNLQRSNHEAWMAKESAEVAEKAAVLSEGKAQELARKYQAERDESERRGKSSAPQFVTQGINLWGQYKPKEALLSLEAALQLDSQNYKASEYKVRILFSLYRFSDVIDFLEFKEDLKSKSMIADCLNLSQAYRNLQQPIKNEQKLTLISKTLNSSYTHNSRLADDLVLTFIGLELPIDERIAYSKQLIMMFNPNLKKLNFKFDKNKKALDISQNLEMVWAKSLSNFPAEYLDISHSGLKDCLSFKDMPLIEVNAESSGLTEFQIAYGTKVKKLDLSHTVINKLTHVPYGIEQLNISYTGVKSLKKLSRIRSLRELRISKGQISPEELEKLADGVKIIINQ